MACSCWVTSVLLVTFVSVVAGHGNNTHASCVIDPGTGSGAQNISGRIFFTQPKTGGNTTMTVKLSGFNPSHDGKKYGFHIHAKGDLGNQCKDAGGHHNPHGKQHAGPDDADRHVGDLGNLVQDSNGTVNVRIKDDMVSIVGDNSVVGLAMVIHEGEDDLGRGNFSDSKTTGHAGARLGCCIITVPTKKPVETTTEEPNSAASCGLHRFLLAMVTVGCVWRHLWQG